jgi:hypothetical protein
MRMRGLAALLVTVPAPLAAQLACTLAFGARAGSALVRDSIVRPFAVRPALAPAVALTVGTPLDRRWTVQATVDLSTAGFARHDAGGSTTDLGHVTTVAFTVGLARHLPAGFDAAAGVGGLKYLPAADAGIFRAGGGAVAPLGALTLSHAVPLARRLAVALRYDVHGFITPALRDEGFTSSRTVQRVALALRVALAGAP